MPSCAAPPGPPLCGNTTTSQACEALSLQSVYTYASCSSEKRKKSKQLLCPTPQQAVKDAPTQVPHCDVVLDTKDKRNCAVVHGHDGGTLVAEVQALYSLTDDQGTQCSPAAAWWVEYCPLYTIDQLQRLHDELGGMPLELPRDTDESLELVRGMSRQHAPVAHVAGCLTVRKSRAGMGAIRLQGGGRFHRLTYDEAQQRLAID